MGMKMVWILQKAYDRTATCQKGLSCLYLFSFATLKEKKM